VGIRKPRTRTRDEQNQDNRRRVLEAARTVFLAEGYHGATLDRVAEEAGFTKGAVYSRFASKADLFLELYQERVEATAATVRALPPARASTTMEAIVGRWLTTTRNDPAWSMLVIEFRVAAARDRTLAARYAAIHERLVEAIAAAVARDLEATGLAPVSTALEQARLGLAFATGFLLERATAPGLSDAAFLRANHALVAASTRPRGRS
jgi:AcrR family transcriptional regulator